MLKHVIAAAVAIYLLVGCDGYSQTPGDINVLGSGSYVASKTEVVHYITGNRVDANGRLRENQTLVSVTVHLPDDANVVSDTHAGSNVDDVRIYRYEFSYGLAKSKESYQVERSLSAVIVVDERARTVSVDGKQYPIDRIPLQVTVRFDAEGRVIVERTP